MTIGLVYSELTGYVESVVFGDPSAATIPDGFALVIREEEDFNDREYRVNPGNPTGPYLPLSDIALVPATGTGVISFEIPIGTAVRVVSPSGDGAVSVCEDGVVSFDMDSDPGSWHVSMRLAGYKPFDGYIQYG